MSFNNIEIARLRIEEARQNGVRDSDLRRILVEAEGEQKVNWFKTIIQRWIERSVQRTANGQRRTVEADCQQMMADC